MLEYVFFDRRPRGLFLDVLRDNDVVFDLLDKEDELLVLIADDYPEALMAVIERCFESTLKMSETLMAEDEGVDSFEMAGVEVTLDQQTSVMASVDARVLEKILSVLNFDELSSFVDSISTAVLHPDHRPLCKRQ